MSSINGISGNLSVNPLNSTFKSAAAPSAGATPARGDSVELSTENVGQYLNILKNNNVRTDKVASAKAAIAAGTYDDDYKLDVAVNRLLDDING